MDTITLGDMTFPLVPQKHTTIKKGVARLFDSLSDGRDVDTGNGIVGMLESRAYDAIKLFVPLFMSREDFMGEGPDGDAHVPTIPEIRLAISEGLKVNGITGFTSLAALVPLLPMELIKAVIAEQIAGAVASSRSSKSLTSRSTSGASDSTSSSTSPPTSETEALSGSLSPASEDSLPPATADASGPSGKLPSL